ncbi:MAG TPA: redoxin domain-containing protein, partial [Verrucomicrobiae bacterium]|nr:redoxin domain-containing protein [Verrucomicrobiae bacterium]
IFVGDFVVGTDEDGRFLFVNLPANSDFYAYGIMKSLADKGAVAAQRVRGQSDGGEIDLGDLTVGPSYTVSGRVRLTDGQSVPEKTRVLLGRSQAWDTLQAEVDAQGAFRFEGVPAESVHLSCRIKGYRYSYRNASLDPANPFRLIGKVTTNISNLIVELESGKRTTDSQSSIHGLADEPLRGAEEPKRAGDIKVTGTVTDNDTGKPISEFNVTQGREDISRTTFEWQPTRKDSWTNGAFELFLNKQTRAPGLLIEAAGYLPVSSGAITTAETNLSIALKRGKGVHGVVLKPNGEPAAGIKVYLPDMKNAVYVADRTEVRERVYKTTVTRTDDSGRFSFAPQIDAFSLVVVDDAGFMDVRVDSINEDARLTLQPWARVEGKLLIGNAPGTNEIVRLGSAHIPYENHPRSFPPISLFLTTQTDNDGKFVFERVPPFAVQVCHQPKVRDSRTGTIPESQTTKFLVKPGETRTLVLGGKGRPVVGRVVVNGYEDKINWRNDVYRLDTVVPEPEDLPDLRALSREYSESLRKASTDDQKKAVRADHDGRRKTAMEQTRVFYASEAGRNYHFAKRQFVLNFSEDGSFRVEDVPPGKYKLDIDLRAGDGDSFSRMSAPRIGQVQKEIEVPYAGKEWTEQPFDLGTIDMDAKPVLTKGKSAPDFEVKTLDDKTIKLSDFRGKYVLLDFWAVWCGPCVAETPHLKETYNAFKSDSRFAMIGLILDPDMAAPRKYAKTNALGWIHGFLGEWSKTDVPNRFGVESIPSIFLIGPDGNVIASRLRGANIKSSVAAALRTPTAKK